MNVPEHLQLKNQLCFPIYATSRLMTRIYQPLLESLDLTYTQYLAMLVLWEHGSLSVSQIGEQLLLESNTLTPLLKKLEQKGLITRQRQPHDERTVTVSLTDKGQALQAEAACIPEKLMEGTNLSLEQIMEIKNFMWKLLDQIRP